MHRRGWFIATLLLLGSFAFVPSDASAQVKQAGNFGIGLGITNVAYPISMKYFLESDLSIQGIVGPWNRGWWRGSHCHGSGRNHYCHDTDGFGEIVGLGADLLYEGQDLAGNGKVSLSWEAGGGLGVGIGEEQYDRDDPYYYDHDGVFFGLVVSGVVGLQLNIDALPLDVVVEYRPNLLIAPDVDFNFFDGGFHVRYYF